MKLEFNEKLQELRKNRNLTQEQLAEQLYVSRTAISKWESGRGYPSIDSLKEISKYYDVSLDDLLSNEEILKVAEEEHENKLHHFTDIVFGLLDCSVASFLFVPFFGEKVGDVIKSVSLFEVTQMPLYIKIPYLIIIIALVICGVITLAIQNSSNRFWNQIKWKISLGFGAIGTLVFTIILEPYAAMFLLIFLVIKALMLIKWS